MDSTPAQTEHVGFTSHGPDASTSDTQLASALLTLGIEPVCCPQRIVTEHSSDDRIIWLFEPKSQCGLYDTAEMIEKWNDRAWLTTPDNEHPLAYLACQMHNYNSLRKVLARSTPMGLVKKGSRTALLPLNASEAHKNKIFKHL